MIKRDIKTRLYAINRTAGANSRAGQAVVFLVMALVILLFAALWSADIHRVLFVKDRAQTAGDAAALAAARWQASSLNLLGELNLMHAMALAVGDAAAVDLVTNTQKRLCFTGPLVGLAAAQQAAKLNGIYVNDDFSDLIRERSEVVRNRYGASVGGVTAIPEPYEGAWEEYARMLEVIADDGVAAGPDNAVFFSDPAAGHLLMDRGFYEAVAGRSWCWFFLNAPGLLDNYTDYTWWPGLPAQPIRTFGNSEIFGLGVIERAGPLRLMISEQTLSRATAEARLNWNPDPYNRRQDREQIWFAYRRQEWRSWSEMDPPFPVVGPVRGEYNYRGADTVIRVEAGVDRMSSQGSGRRGGGRDSIAWTAAAKPFGYLSLESSRETPQNYGLVLPAFRQVRLIPVDTASMPGGGSFSIAWRRHVTEHLPGYVANGPSSINRRCRYCASLLVWEDAAFRREGVDWLQLYSSRCTVRGTGPGSSGGTRRAH